MKTTAERLKAWLKRENFTQFQGAQRLRVSLASLSLWVRGEREPQGLYAEKVERVLRRSESLANEGGE